MSVSDHFIDCGDHLKGTARNKIVSTSRSGCADCAVEGDTSHGREVRVCSQSNRSSCEHKGAVCRVRNLQADGPQLEEPFHPERDGPV